MRAIYVALFAVAGLTVGCATTTESPTGRTRSVMLNERGLHQSMSNAYENLKRRMPIETDAAQQTYANCVVRAIVQELDAAEDREGWEITVFKTTDPIAFAWPGKKVGVATSVVERTGDAHMLAALLAPRIAAVVARHLSEEQANVVTSSEFWSGLGKALIGIRSTPPRRGPNLVTTMEADSMGLVAMAKAGFDPQALYALIERIATDTPEQAEFRESRLSNVQQRIPGAKRLFDAALPVYGENRCPRVEPWSSPTPQPAG